MSKIKAIINRHSVRQYKDIPIEQEKIDELKKEIEFCNDFGGLNIQLVTNDEDAFQGFMAHYGHFSGVRNYIAMVGKDEKLLEEKIGYCGEMLVVKAAELGLNTCWVALTYSKRRAHVDIGEDEKLVCVIALGYGENQGVEHSYKPLEKIAKLSDDDPEWYKNGVTLARMAPTAMNQQKYYIERQGNVVKITHGIGFYTKVDVGIVRYHFEVGAGKENFKWFGEENAMKIADDEEHEQKNVVIISSTPRKNGNSERLCQEFANGAIDAGHKVSIVRIADLKINYCVACHECAKTHECVFDDDMKGVIEKLLKADVIVFSSPVHFYNMSGQLKVFIDRLLPCYDKLEADIYLIATGHDKDEQNLKHALEGIRGLTYDCLIHCKEKGRIVAGGVTKVGDIEGRQELKLAYQMGHNI